MFEGKFLENGANEFKCLSSKTGIMPIAIELRLDKCSENSATKDKTRYVEIWEG